MKITKKQIDKVLNGFDFDRCAEVYSLLNWTWWSLGKIPNSNDLRELAIRLLGDLRKSTTESIRSGGLKVSRYVEDRVLVVKLEFIALSSVHDNLDLE